MLLKGNQAIVNLVESIKEQEANKDKAQIIGIKFKYIEWFKDSITDEEVKILSKIYPELDIHNDYIEAIFNIHLLFYKGWCFDTINKSAHLEKSNEFRFTSNHYSRWTSGAFEGVNNKIYEIVDSIFEIHKKHNLENVLIPRHIIPNYTKVYNGLPFVIDETELCGTYGNRIHILEMQEEITLKVKDWDKDLNFV